MNPERPSEGEQGGFSQAEELKQALGQPAAEKPKASWWRKRAVQGAAILGIGGLLGGGGAEAVKPHHEPTEPRQPTPELSTPPATTERPIQTPEVQTVKLPEADLEKMVSATNFESLKGHQLSQLDRKTTPSGTELVVVGIDGAEQAVPTAELVKMQQYFEHLGKSNLTLEHSYKPDGVTPKNVEYQLTPWNTGTEYVVFTNGDLNAISPELTAHDSGIQGSTVNNPAVGASVSFIRHGESSGNAAIDQRVGNDRLTAAIELCQAEVAVTGGTEDPEQAIGQETICDGYGRAFTLAEAGFTYSEYQTYMQSVPPMDAFAKYDARDYVLGDASYETLISQTRGNS